MRQRKKSEHLNDYITEEELFDVINLNSDVNSNVSDTPDIYEDAINSPDYRKWKNAMNEEFNSLKENNTFTLTLLQKDKNAVGGRWVYTIKEDIDGNIINKARYVAKGYSQTKGIDYNETYAPTTKMTSVRTLMQLAVQNDYIVHQMDVKTAYLNAQ